ncbi:MAG: hypothetical protein ACOYL5_06110 [Phototrophicaceae bacterium]|jgi:cell division protein FtsB
MKKPPKLLENLSQETLLALIDHQAQQIEALKAEIAHLKRETEKLEARLSKNSSNKPLSPMRSAPQYNMGRTC